MQRCTHQNGVALITALLVVSLATILAISLINHLNFDIRRTENILRLDQAQLYNANAVEFGMSLLRLDREANNEHDSFEEYSLANTQVFPVTGGEVSAVILDLQGCFNLNNLSKNNTDLPRQRTAYRRLLATLNVDSNLHATLVDSLVDWLDVDDINEPQGAEFDYYIGLEKPYRTANGLMASPSELRLVKGYDAKILDLIKDHICVLPVISTGININTASAEMIESIDGLQGKSEQIIKLRDGEPENAEDNEPFARLEDFTKYTKDTLKVDQFDATGLQVYSEYFLMESKTQLGTGDVKLYSIIYRSQSDGKTELIHQSRGAL